MRWVLLGLTVACSEAQVGPTSPPPGLTEAPPESIPWVEQRYETVQRPVDVLLVLDNSGSMGEERGLAPATGVLLDRLLASELDFRIAVAYATPNETEVLRQVDGYWFVARDTPGAHSRLYAMADIPPYGFGPHTLAAVHTVVTNPAQDEGIAAFYRPEADLHILAVSDDSLLGFLPAFSYLDYPAWAQLHKPWRGGMTFHCIAVVERLCPTADTSSLNADCPLLIDDRSGVYDICVTDWAPYLEDLAARVLSPPRHEFTLTSLPVIDPWTLDVRTVSETEAGPVEQSRVSCLAGEETEDCEVIWIPRRNTVAFLDPQEHGITVLVGYQPR